MENNNITESAKKEREDYFWEDHEHFGMSYAGWREDILVEKINNLQNILDTENLADKVKKHLEDYIASLNFQLDGIRERSGRGI